MKGVIESLVYSVLVLISGCAMYMYVLLGWLKQAALTR